MIESANNNNMLELNERKKILLSLIVEEHIKSANPVGSKFLADKSKMDLSPATLRNEMSELEQREYIYQPYTSSGRIPSEKGYKFYIENFLHRNKEVAVKRRKVISKTLQEAEKGENNIYKHLAKTMAGLIPVTVILAFSKDNLYYTGLANLFSQPEFKNIDLICNITEIIDKLDEVMLDIFDNTDTDIDIYLGKENPFGESCGTIITSYQNKVNKSKGVIGFLGPMRMDYQSSYSLIKYSKELINNL